MVYLLNIGVTFHIEIQKLAYLEPKLLIKYSLDKYKIKLPPAWQHALSYMKAQLVARSQKDRNELLELYIHKGEYRLEYGGAIYAYGAYYYAFHPLLPLLQQHNKPLENVLMLGGAIGAVLSQIENLNIRSNYDFVEIDEELIAWAKQILDPDLLTRTNFICEDAFFHVIKSKKKYDLILIDIFDEMEMPEFLYDPAWWQSLYYLGSDHTIIAWNAYSETKQGQKALGNFINRVLKPQFGIPKIYAKEKNKMVVFGEINDVIGNEG